PAAACGQDQDRQCPAVAAQALHHLQSAELGQAEIDDGEVDRILARLEQAIFAVAGLVDAVAVAFELPRQPEPEGRVVLDQQQAHAGARAAQPTTRPLAASIRITLTSPFAVRTLTRHTGRRSASVRSTD